MPQRSAKTPFFKRLVEERRVIVCVGCGGVGKTTTSAAVAIAAARLGKRVLALTVDPARRLAGSLGVDPHNNDAQAVSLAALGEEIPGTVSVLMLDTKSIFDAVVTRHASSEAVRRRIMDNPLYEHLSTRLAGVQDFMAMEKMLELQASPDFDLLVLDTPPTRNALDFLSAPERMVDALDSSAVRWFLQAFGDSGRFSFDLLSRGITRVLAGLARITSSEFLGQVAVLLRDLNDLFGGFRERALRISEAFRKPDVAYVVVSSPEQLALDEARFFAEHLVSEGMHPDALVINRVRALLPDDAVGVALGEARSRGVAFEAGAEERVATILGEEAELARAEHARITAATTGISKSRTLCVPLLTSDVHEVRALGRVARYLDPAAP